MTIHLNAQKNLEAWKKSQKTLPLKFRSSGEFRVAGDDSYRTSKLLRLSRLESLQDLPANPESSDSLPTEATPAEEDFINVTYRAISAAMLADRPVDFSKANVLKKATPMLVGQTVFKDHETSVDNWVGRVVNTYWDTKTEGFPPGINAILQLDMVKDPMAVRGVLQGALHSASVTVSFNWIPSHPKLMEDGTFFNLLGEEVDGEMVRIIADEIEKFWEISLVWQGADQYAKQIDDNGTPVLDPNLSVAAEFNGHNHTGTVAEFMTYTGNKILVPQPSASDFNHSTNSNHGSSEGTWISAQVGGPFDQTRKENEMEKLKELLAALGIQVKEDATQEEILAQFKAMKDSEKQLKDELFVSQTSLKTAQEELVASQKKTAELEGKVVELTPQAELGKKYLEDERKEAVRLYKVSKDEKEVNPVILKTLEKSDLDVVQAWKAEFKKDAEEKFPNKCQKCGATELSRRSSVAPAVTTEQQSGVLPADVAANVRNLHS